MKYLIAALVIAAFAGSLATAARADASPRNCYGWKAWVTVPHEVKFTADRARARGTTCANARSLIRAFLLEEGTNPDCAADASEAGRTCVVKGYSCDVRGRSSCRKGSTLVTFRHWSEGIR